mmetsp:Transcript_26901/g.77504  ORF Transcript_26901/g.77504 Transcript_26901/m.77504 type:complete len:325 (-) Transcript_26901:697-1671(-)
MQFLHVPSRQTHERDCHNPLLPGERLRREGRAPLLREPGQVQHPHLPGRPRPEGARREPRLLQHGLRRGGRGHVLRKGRAGGASRGRHRGAHQRRRDLRHQLRFRRGRPARARVGPARRRGPQQPAARRPDLREQGEGRVPPPQVLLRLGSRGPQRRDLRGQVRRRGGGPARSWVGPAGDRRPGPHLRPLRAAGRGRAGHRQQDARRLPEGGVRRRHRDEGQQRRDLHRPERGRPGGAPRARVGRARHRRGGPQLRHGCAQGRRGSRGEPWRQGGVLADGRGSDADEVPSGLRAQSEGGWYIHNQLRLRRHGGQRAGLGNQGPR